MDILMRNLNISKIFCMDDLPKKSFHIVHNFIIFMLSDETNEIKVF